MTVVVKELLSAANASDSGTDVSIQRGFQVTELAGDPAGRAPAAMDHPGFVYALNRNVKMTGQTQAIVTVNYGVPKTDRGDAGPGSGGGLDGTEPGIDEEADPGTISVGSSSQTIKVFKDRKGKLLTVGHIVEVEKKVADPKTGIVSKVKVKEPDIQLREAEITIPQTVLRVSRIESGSPDIKSRKYVGTVNSKALGISKSGRGKDGPRTWLCTRIDGTSNDGGKTYNVTYEFQYDHLEWGFVATWIDKKTGQPAFTDLTGEESIFYETYDEEDFNDLGILFEGDTSKK
jgi:hypothetical protein